MTKIQKKGARVLNPFSWLAIKRKPLKLVAANKIAKPYCSNNTLPATAL